MVKNLPNYKYHNVNVLVCLSYSEGMPNVVLEGMASGCAIIATDVGAVSEIVDKTNGWLIKKDIVEGLQKAFDYFLNCDTKELNTLQASSVRKVKAHFTWEKVIQQTILEIKTCI